MEADTKTVLFLYWITLHGTTGINLYKVVPEVYCTCTTVSTEKKSLYETYSASLPRV